MGLTSLSPCCGVRVRKYGEDYHCSICGEQIDKLSLKSFGKYKDSTKRSKDKVYLLIQKLVKDNKKMPNKELLIKMQEIAPNVSIATLYRYRRQLEL